MLCDFCHQSMHQVLNSTLSVMRRKGRKTTSNIIEGYVTIVLILNIYIIIFNILNIYILFLLLANPCNAQSIDHAVGQYGGNNITGDNITVVCEEGYHLNTGTSDPLVCNESGEWESSITCDGKQQTNINPLCVVIFGDIHVY